MTALETPPEQAFKIPSSVSISVSARTLAVWGSAGSGKSMLAVNLAFEIASKNLKVLLVDLDSRRPSLASMLGLTDAGPGITAVTRLGRQDRLNVEELKRLAAEIKFGSAALDVLVGMNSPARWPELDSLGLKAFLDLAQLEYDWIIFDLNDELEAGLVSSKSAQDRNFVTRWAIENSNLTLATFVADPLGLNRFLFDIRGLTSDYWAIANLVAPNAFGKNAEREIRQALHQVGRIDAKALLPIDHSSVSWQIQSAKPLLMQPKSSKLATAIQLLSLDILDSCGQAINSGT